MTNELKLFYPEGRKCLYFNTTICVRRMTTNGKPRYWGANCNQIFYFNEKYILRIF